MRHPHPMAAAALAILTCTAGGCSQADASKVPPHAAARRVAVVRARRCDVARRIELPANVLALEQATILAQVPGYLVEIRVDKGDPVHERDVLAVISVPELDQQIASLRAALAQAAAETKAAGTALERARAEDDQAAAEVGKAEAALALEALLLDRTSALRKDEAVSVQDQEVASARHAQADQTVRVARARRAALAAAAREAEARVEVAGARADVARAALAQAQARKELATIRAPFGGRVTARFVDRGALISQGAPVVTVASMDRVRVQLHVPETDVAAVREGIDIELSVDAWPGRPFRGKVARFARALDPSSRTMLVEAELENGGGALMPGMFARARLELERHPGTLTVPAEAIDREGARPFVWRIDGGVARRVAIETSIDDGATIEVTGGLSEGDVLIVGGRGLTDGAPVEPVEPVEPGPGASRTEG